MAYRPVGFATLKIFPWFAFARVADRATVIYPALFTTLALSLDLRGLGSRPRRAVVSAMLLLGAVELRTSLSIPKNHRRRVYPPEFFDYMATVRRTEGSAVLDFPFCVTGGNGVGSAQGLCPYYVASHVDASYAPYHGKKIVGGYFGRLTPSQLEPFLRAHWERMFVADDPNIFRARSQVRCLDEDEWAFLTAFFTLNDFAGLQLHTSLLPATCVEAFYARLGPPEAKLSLPGGIELAFVPKPQALRGRVDPVLGRSLRLRRTLEPHPEPLDALEIGDPARLEVDGLSAPEYLGAERWRWGLGATTSVGFTLPEARPMALRFSFVGPEPGQSVEVAVNGAIAARFGTEALAGRGWISQDISFEGAEGANRIEFRSAVWNGKDGVWFAPKDRRPISLRFGRMRVE
jgi:hypothetical protein